MARRAEEVVISGFALMHAVQCRAGVLSPQLSEQLEQATWQQTERELTRDKRQCVSAKGNVCDSNHMPTRFTLPMESNVHCLGD